MKATSSEQFERTRAGQAPSLEQVTPNTWAIGVPMPQGGPIRYTLCYILQDADGKLHLIDPGWDTDVNLTRLDQALESLGGSVSALKTIIVTHLHGDHLDLAVRLREQSGSLLVMHPIEQQGITWMGDGTSYENVMNTELDKWQVPPERVEEVRAAVRPPTPQVVTTAEVLVEDGSLLPIPGRRIRALHTPGHTSGHLCLRDEDNGLLFTGDHVLPQIHPGVGLGGRSTANPLEQYLDSLARLLPFGDDEALPGHGYRFSGLGERVRQHATHQLHRSQEVSELLGKDENLSIWQIASGLSWSAGWANMRGFLLMSALQQTGLHRDLVRSGRLPEFLNTWAE